MKREAHIIGDYRYWLRRVWNLNLPRVTFVGLNPSTANAEKDDATIRKCIGFAHRWGMGELLMLNLFAFRSTNPSVLKDVPHPVSDFSLEGRDSYYAAFTRVKKNELVVCCWGSSLPRHGLFQPNTVLHLLRDREAKLRAFQLNKNGSPKHPLYVGYSRKLVHYRGVKEGALL